jgi:peptidoglycan glycosyltransferase
VTRETLTTATAETRRIGRLRRTTELGLIVLAVVITGGAYTLSALGRTATLPANIGPFLAIVFGLLIVAHVAVRRLAPAADPVLLAVAALLNGLGYVVIARLDQSLASKQAMWTAVGVAAFLATLFLVRRVSDLQRYRYTLGLVGIALLLIPLLPGVGRSVNGARIWVYLGPLSFQPGELAKIALVVFFAAYLVEKRELLGMATWPKMRPILPDPKHLAPILIAWGVSLLVLTAENDLGQSLLLFTLFLIMLWIATQRASYLGVGLALFAAGTYFAYHSITHVKSRIVDWLNPWQPIAVKGGTSVKGYQIVQGAFALSAGGVAGTGLGLGTPKLIPEVQNDFIFAAIGEELGLLGATIVIIAYLAMIGAGLRVAARSRTPFDKLLAAGLTALLGIQSFIILAGVTRLLPLTGVALPFVSYGGSALVSSYILLAVLLRVSDETNRRLDADAVREQLQQEPAPA